MKRMGEMEDRQIYNTFNMGIGMVIAVAKEDAQSAFNALKDLGEDPCILGETVKGEGILL
jgi:phosphoribosylformylglycinamidine cyclo-ligase